MFAPKPKKKYEPITPVDLRLNLNRSKRDMVPNPKYNPKDPNSKKEVSRQKFDIDNRNIYTGKLLKPSSVDKSTKGYSSSVAKKITGNTFRSKGLKVFDKKK